MIAKKLFRKPVAILCAALTAFGPLTACDPSSIGGPDRTEQKATDNSPSHEIRVLVDAEGKIKGMEAVRVKSKRPNFVAKSAEGLGTKLSSLAPWQTDIVSKIQAKGTGLVSVAFYQVPQGYQRPSRRTAGIVASASMRDYMPTDPPGWVQSSGYPTLWDPNTDSLTTADHEAFVDATLNEFAGIGDAAFEEYADPYGLDQMRAAPAPDALIMGLSTFAPYSSPPAAPSALRIPDCTVQRVALVAATVVGAGVIVIAGQAIVAAAAPVAFTLGGISGMALPSAGTVFLARAANWSIISGTVAGLASAWWSTWNCKNETV